MKNQTALRYVVLNVEEANQLVDSGIPRHHISLLKDIPFISKAALKSSNVQFSDQALHAMDKLSIKDNTEKKE